MFPFGPTPGPWQFQPADSGDDSVGIGYTPGLIFHETEEGNVVEIAVLSVPAYSEEPDPNNEYDDGIRTVGNQDCNGTLMAASPNLLAALEEIYNDLKQGAIPDPDDNWWEKARTAISEARGGK